MMPSPLFARMSRSLQARLSLWLALAIVAVGVVAGALSFAAAFHEAIELQDDQLRQFAALLDRFGGAPPAARDSASGDPSDARIVVHALAASGAAPGPAGPLDGISATLPEGLQTVQIQDDGWRVFVKTLASGDRLAIGQRTDFRDDIASTGAWQTLLPLLVLLPVLLLLVALLVRGALAPFKARAAEVDRRAEEDLSPVESDDLPTEIRPFVTAINRLLARVSDAIDAQRRFVADAAHELRSPITALSLQAERAAQAAALPEATERLAMLRKGLSRTRQLLDQLLALARAQSDGAVALREISLRDALRGVLEDLMPLAEAKRIDLGVEGHSDGRVAATEIQLKTLIGNLVENAIRYTPAGGRVDVSITAAPGRILLTVTDTGPGIEPAERERVFDPFYRVLGSAETGSGLGLSIVRTIAARIGAEVSLDEAGGEGTATGLRAMVAFNQPAG